MYVLSRQTHPLFAPQTVYSCLFYISLLFQVPRASENEKCIKLPPSGLTLLNNAPEFEKERYTLEKWGLEAPIIYCGQSKLCHLRLLGKDGVFIIRGFL